MNFLFLELTLFSNKCFSISESDFHSSTSITVNAGSDKGCTDFFELVVNDDVGAEEDEAFTIVVGSSMAMVIIVDDDGMKVIIFY